MSFKKGVGFLSFFFVAFLFKLRATSVLNILAFSGKFNLTTFLDGKQRDVDGERQTNLSDDLISLPNSNFPMDV